LRPTSVYATTQDEITVGGTEFSQIRSTINTIKKAAQVINDSVNNIFHNKDLTPETISIKIPSIKDFQELSEIVDKLKKSISLPVSEVENGGETKILDFDSGTFWIDALLPTTYAVSFKRRLHSKLMQKV
jgi:hypothetical protein